jgi:hypothetical protein
MLIRDCIRKAFMKLWEMKFLAAVVEMMAIRKKTRACSVWERTGDTFHKLAYTSLSPGTADN